MAQDLPRISANVVIPKPLLQQVFDNLRASDFSLIGPTVREGAVVLDEISRLEDLPLGWMAEQAPGRYRLKQTGHQEYFFYGVGPDSWKKFLHVPQLKLFSVEKTDGKWVFKPNQDAIPPRAFIGVRACDLSAIGVQDRVFLSGEFQDPHYMRRRERIFILAANCGRAYSTCFCTSMKTGPKVTGGFDLALTELPNAFVIEVGSEMGSEMLRDVSWEPATAFDLGRAAQSVQNAEREIERQLSTDDLPKMLYDNLEHPRWDDVAARCLSCGNCTQVCPTCFCVTVEDTCDLKATVAERTRIWDSCYVQEFSHVHGGNIRPTIRSRYRQWLTHKLASWIDQFGTSGCVGCGRCITWCPVGIDLTEEVKAIREKVQR
jgi:sulfhydrogenase subunit beta (sulfur reductase)